MTPRIIRASGRGDYYFDPFNEIATETNNFVNLNVRLDAPSWSVGLWGRNVGDVRHATNISIGSSNRNRVQNRPRSFGLEATYRFQHNADGFALLRESQFHAVCPEISIDVRIGFNSSSIRGLDALKAFTK